LTVVRGDPPDLLGCGLRLAETGPHLPPRRSQLLLSVAR
jgi:hypothetical protein